MVVYLANQAKKISFSGDGTRVLVEGQSKKAEYRAFTEGAALPSKLQPWYIYAAEFVEVLRLKTPKVICKRASK